MIDNNCSNNVGWGIHLYQSSHNIIKDNEANNVWRKGDCDTSGILLACSSSYNTIAKNKFRHSGDGIYLAWTPEQEKPVCCSNDYNIIRENDGSYASANCFESDFSVGCQFINNTAVGARFGFWLGYSRGNTILSNNVIMNNAWSGIAIEHGQDIVIERNIIANNGHYITKQYPLPWQPKGILLWSNLQDDYPITKFPCLTGFDHTLSTNYTIASNVFWNNTDGDINLQNTTQTLVYNNLFVDSNNPIQDQQTVTGNSFNLQDIKPGTNIIGGKFLGGNHYAHYKGCDNTGKGIGNLPFDNQGRMHIADRYPLVNGKC